jgi:archaea-specific DNA-binding protein
LITENTIGEMMADDHAIFVGGKPFMNYVTAVVMQFTTKGANTVVIRSRGKFISRAVDVAEVVKSRFLRDQIDVSNIKMDSEEFKNKEGRTVRVSTLDIELDRISREMRPAEPVAEPIAEPVAKPVEEPVAEPIAELVAKPVEEPVAEPIAEEVEQLDETPEAEPVAKSEKVEETEETEEVEESE